MRVTIFSLLASTAIICSGSAAMAAYASGADTTARNGSSDWWVQTTNIESGAQGYKAQNPISTAVGRYQLLIEHFIKAGYVKKIKSYPDGTKGRDRWSEEYFVFTDKACGRGVCSYEDLTTTQAGYSMQDEVSVVVAHDMWRTMENGAAGRTIGQTYNGLVINEASLLGAAWFLGAGGMNTWAASGFTVDGLRNHSSLGAWIRENSNINSAEDLQVYMMERMETYNVYDISDLTNGQYTPGGGSYTIEEYVYCDPEIEEQMQKEGEAYVNNIVAAAQHDVVGFSQMPEDQSFADMSCIDFSFLSGFEILFDLPSLADIGQMVRDMACSAANEMVGNATAPLNETMRSFADGASFNGVGFGPISAFGVDVQATNDVVGVSGEVSTGTYQQTNPLTGEPIGAETDAGAATTPPKPAYKPILKEETGAYSGLFKR